MMTNELVGERLRGFRVAAGMTQQDVGMRLDVTASRVSEYERGKVAIRATMADDWERICESKRAAP
jgi:transcriptional regulator with XRE-family HTH domain